MQNRIRIENSIGSFYSDMFPSSSVEESDLKVEQAYDRQGNTYGQEIRVEGVYIISVAARILEMHPQTLRKYERLGLIQPQRTNGMLRLYSQDDISKILLIRHLMENLGLNLEKTKLIKVIFSSFLALLSAYWIPREGAGLLLGVFVFGLTYFGSAVLIGGIPPRLIKSYAIAMVRATKI